MEIQKVKTLAKDKLEFVSSIITNSNGNVLILKRRKDLSLDPGKYDLCSGHMKNGEIPLQSMYRELKEELGINPEQVKRMELIGTIKTPHKKLINTVTHIYSVEIDIEKEKINEMVSNVSKPEIEQVTYLQSIESLREMIAYTENFRTMLTDEVEDTLRKIEDKINKRKEEKEDLCEER